MTSKGFTLVELIIYIGIIALMSISMTSLYIKIIQLRSQSSAIQEVNQSVRLASSRINYEVKQAKSINGVGTSLSLNMFDSTRNPTIFDLNNGRIRLTVGTSVAYLTSNRVDISNFTLTNLSTGDSLSQNIRYTITGSYLSNTATITNSVEVRSQ